MYSYLRNMIVSMITPYLDLLMRMRARKVGEKKGSRKYLFLYCFFFFFSSLISYKTLTVENVEKISRGKPGRGFLSYTYSTERPDNTLVENT